MGTLLVDIASREKEYIFDLAKLLQTQYDIYVDDQDGYFLPKGCNFFERNKIDSDFIITPSYSSHRTYYLRLRSLFSKAPLVLYHSEQIVHPDFLSDKLDYRGGSKFLSDIALHLTWGVDFAQTLISRGVDPKKIVIVGSPRVKNKIKLQPKSINTIKKILVITSFDPADWTEEQWLNECKTYDYDPEIRMHKKYFNSRKAYLSLLKNIIKQNKNIEFELRTHPGESLEYYAERLGNFKNVKMHKGDDKPLSKSLEEIDFVISPNHSTIVFDLYALGVNYALVNTEAITDNLYPKEAYRSISYKDVSDLTALINFSNKSIKNMEKHFEHIFSINSIDVEERILKSLELINECNNKFDFKDIFNISKLYFKYAISQVSINMSNILPYNPIVEKLKHNEREWIELGHGLAKNGPVVFKKLNKSTSSAKINICKKTGVNIVE